MTTQEFIRKAYEGTTTKERCSSVFRDGRDVYSYGYHYPLLFRVGGLTFINTTGYSNTTQRHILWAKQAVDYQYIGVELHGKRLSALTLQDIETYIMSKIVKLNSEMNSKKRKDTQVYRDLQAQLEQQVQWLKEVRDAS